MAKKTVKKIMENLVQAIDDLGWNVAMPNTGKNVVGLVIGRQDYIDSVMAAIKKAKWKYKQSSIKAKKAGG